MPLRPGDSTPKFDDVEEASDLHQTPLSANTDDAPTEISDIPESADESEEPDFGDSHILDDRIMVPHHSDGTTEVIETGRANSVEDAEEAAEHFSSETNQEQSGSSHDDTFPSTDDSVPQPEEMFSSEDPGPGATAPCSTPNQSSGRNLTMILLASYASAVTIALVFVLLTKSSGSDRAHQLESLPDPLDQDGQIPIYKRDADLPEGHSLKLKDSRRFGNILVEALKVTREPIKFSHFSGNARMRQADSEPVLCLWLKFTNVSEDQEIAPLDGHLLFKRVLNQGGRPVANTFISMTSDTARESAVLSYPHSPTSEFDLVGQNLGRKLKPKESVTIYIPCDSEGLDQLTGELVWRFHMRKGYAPSGNGVTTLVEVVFDQSQVKTNESKG